jgi:ATP-binding cassette, subfamily C (CFTR/MRP), member 1
MTSKLKASFEKRVANGDKYPLLWAIHETFFFEFWLGGFSQLVASIFQVISPFTLRFLIQFAEDAYEAAQKGEPTPHIGTGVGLTIGVTLMQICQSLGTSQFIFRGMMIGGQTRAVLISTIYAKAMVISGRARAGGVKPQEPSDDESSGEKGKQEGKQRGAESKKGSKPAKAVMDEGWTNGRIVNLMSVDTYRIDQASALFHMIWTAPIQCIITLALLLVNLTYSALAGFGLLVLGVPLLTRAIQSLFRRRAAINKVTDQRVGLTQEILSSVRFVKYFGWEGAFLERLKSIRTREIHSIQLLLAIRNAINAVSMSLPIYASLLSFITYSLTSHGLSPAEVFSSLALFNSLRMPLNLLPLVIGSVVDAWSSINRCQGFLLSEEQGDEAIHKPDCPNAVEVVDGSFTWERNTTQDSNKTAPVSNGKKGKPDNLVSDTGSTLVEEREPFKLQDLNFEIGRNELVAVIGSVGSGKTSLLAALAGDMRKTSGEVVLGASRAFCPQYAWIQNATIRENILFGKEMDRSWYKEVIRA